MKRVLSPATGELPLQMDGLEPGTPRSLVLHSWLASPAQLSKIVTTSTLLLFTSRVFTAASSLSTVDTTSLSPAHYPKLQ